jgi:hypothetical protein
MKFKNLIALFLILVLSIQFLPIQRIAAWLSSGQVTEEIDHGLDNSNSKSQPHEKDPAILLSFLNSSGQALLTPLPNKFHTDETLLIRDADEILTPPPNE